MKPHPAFLRHRHEDGDGGGDGGRPRVDGKTQRRRCGATKPWRNSGRLNPHSTRTNCTNVKPNFPHPFLDLTEAAITRKNKNC